LGDRLGILSLRGGTTKQSWIGTGDCGVPFNRSQ